MNIGIQEKDETAELAAALGEAQQAQAEAEGKFVSANLMVESQRKRIAYLEERVAQLEVANVRMDDILQGYRVTKTNNPASIDRG